MTEREDDSIQRNEPLPGSLEGLDAVGYGDRGFPELYVDGETRQAIQEAIDRGFDVDRIRRIISERVRGTGRNERWYDGTN